MTAPKKIGVPTRFLRSMMASVLGRIVVILLLVEGIFLGEKFPELFNTVMDRHGGLRDVVLLLACATPEIFDLALGLALLLAVYQALLRSRENREMLVIAGAGTGTFEFIAFLLVIGLAGLFASIVISGLVQPAAQYAKRVVLFDAEYNALLHGGGSDQFYAFPNHTVYVIPQSGQPESHRVFIEERNTNHTYAIRSDAARLSKGLEDGQLLLSLSAIEMVDVDRTPGNDANAAPPRRPAGKLDGSSTDFFQIEATSANQRLSLTDLIPFRSRGGTTDEMTIFALIQKAVGSLTGDENEVRAFGDLVAQGLLSLFAPLLAAVALCLTNRKTQAFAIPAALLLLVATNLLMVALVRFLANFGASALLIVVVFAGVVTVVALVTLIRRMQSQLLLPMLGRP
jgi:lipopolysaccharide export LptBFGC system permease protein LptF